MDSEGEESVKVLDALKVGIKLESYGIKFYTSTSKNVKDPKDSFEKKDASVKDIIKAHLESKKGPKIFPEMEEYLGEVKESRGDKKILKEAEEIEKRFIEFYKNSAKSITNQDYKEVFNILVREEEGHLKLIELMTDYMTLHGVWSGLEDYFANE